MIVDVVPLDDVSREDVAVAGAGGELRLVWDEDDKEDLAQPGSFSFVLQR